MSEVVEQHLKNVQVIEFTIIHCIRCTRMNEFSQTIFVTFEMH